jgi:prepilin-type N-terminal cleavage/methylation domain-containing protein
MKRQTAGFTLVELLIVISIIAILSATGLATYINFSRNQLVSQAARKIAQDLRLAQSLASSNQKPESGCGILNGYVFKVDSPTTYSIIPDCTPLYTGKPIKTGSVADNLDLSGFSQVKFKVLRQGVETTGGTTITVRGFVDKSKVVEINGGAIKIRGEEE